MSVPVAEFDPACLKVCPQCRKAFQMSQDNRKGHVLRQRKDTKEFVHDFRHGSSFTHAYCDATPLRNANG